MRCEVANLSRNVVIESADPAGVRGHTMYHRDSSGGISYAEFRHLGKEGVLGRYAIHFHLVRDTMRGSGVLGASIWDSHNRWLTIHGTDYLLVRDCVGYQSRGHGFFLEDATEQYNVLDRNLAVQAFGGKPLPKQVLPFDPNDGAGLLVGERPQHLHAQRRLRERPLRLPFPDREDAQLRSRACACAAPTARSPSGDVRTLPFLRFEDNESHSEGLFGFRFGDEEHGSVHGDREHPFIVRNLRAWAVALRDPAQRAVLPARRPAREGRRVRHLSPRLRRARLSRHRFRQRHRRTDQRRPRRREPPGRRFHLRAPDVLAIAASSAIRSSN